MLPTGPLYPRSNPVMPVSTSLDTMHYAFVTDNYYFVWGFHGLLNTFIPVAPYSAPEFFAEKAGVIYVLWSYGAIRKIEKLVRTSANGWHEAASSAVIPSGQPSIAVWGENAITAYASGTAGFIEIKEYQPSGSALDVVDSYTVSPSIDGSINFLSNPIAIDRDSLYILTNIGTTGNARLIEINLLSKSIVSEELLPQSFAALTYSLLGSIRVSGELISYGARNTGSVYPAFVHNTWKINKIAGSTVPLSAIVQSECLKSDLLTAADIDVTDLTDQVRGYRVSSLAPLRGGIDPLRKAWPFDVVQHGYKIKFKRRGGASVATITSAELDARAAGSDPGVQITNVREMDLVLPNQLVAKYLDAVREYDVNVAEESR
ncbi:MAG: hypothetical protein B7X93_13305 [Hydrogenophilales bacterium 17-61-9]|nr:MAG: hypothetical protein B7X93_13305 [Hydrogenophilales bacterium 17-61-9]